MRLVQNTKRNIKPQAKAGGRNIPKYFSLGARVQHGRSGLNHMVEKDEFGCISLCNLGDIGVAKIACGYGEDPQLEIFFTSSKKHVAVRGDYALRNLRNGLSEVLAFADAEKPTKSVAKNTTDDPNDPF